MINAEIPKNIEEFEPKIAGPFTWRQLVCVALMIVPVGGLAYILNIYFIPKLTIPVCAFVALPFLLCGWWKPFDLGLPFEKFIINYMQQKFVLPAYRKYESDPQNTNPDYVDVNLEPLYEDYNGFEIEKAWFKEHTQMMVSNTVKINKKDKAERDKLLEADRKEFGYFL